MSPETYGFLLALGILLVVVGGPALIAYLLSSALRLKEFSGRIFVAFLALFLGLAPFAKPWVANTLNAVSHERDVSDLAKRVAKAEEAGPEEYNLLNPTAIESIEPGETTKIVTKRPHGFSEGDEIVIGGVEGEDTEPLNGLHTVSSVEDEHELVVAVDTQDTEPTGGRVYETPAPARKQTFEDAVRLGIDLKGGTNLVYEVLDGELEKKAKEGNQSQSAIMERLVGAITNRVNPSGTEEVVVRQVGLDRVEIIMPGAEQDKVDQMKGRITRLGSLEFAILATNSYAPHAELISRAEQLPPTQRDVYINEQLAGGWRDVGRNQVTGKLKDVSSHGDVVYREVEIAGQTTPQYLVAFEPKDARVTGQYLQRASPDRDEAGRPVVAFTFDSTGGHWFFKLTSKYKPREGSAPYRLAVLLDGNIHSAPNLQAVIGRRGQISGVEGNEVDELINVLNAGALEVEIKKAPISEATIGPTLAEDVRSKGILAISIAAGAVVVFMLGYYLFAGLVADLCLVLNLVLVMGAMVLIQATFTLPGLAGIVLTIGMAVDANVLIFERIREEMAKGSRLKMAIQNGFGKAFTTIVDANVTTLLTAVVLYMIGTDQVRGFAVTLFIGIVMSMFTALYVGRLVFDIAERKRWITSLRMNSFVGQTHWDFLGKRTAALGISAILIVGGMFALTSRGEDNLDIDFSGGIMVAFEFEDVRELGPVEEALEEEFGGDVTLERLIREKHEDEPERSAYRLRLKQTQVADKSEELDDVAILGLVKKRIHSRMDEAGLPLRIVTLDKIGTIEEIAAVDEESATDDDRTFAEGHSVELEFSDPITAAAAENNLVAELLKLSATKYEQAVAMVKFTGIPGTEAASSGSERDVARFTGMKLQVTPDVDTEGEDHGDLGKALDAMQETMASSPLFTEVNSFSSSVGTEMKWSAVQAMLVSLIAIIGYIWFRFEQVTFGLAAVAALVHDVLVVLGMVAVASLVSGTPVGSMLDLYDFKINLPMIAAFLTIVGYSLNDTIVVFDRIREVRGKNPALTTEMVNTSLNQTLARTLLTSLTTFIVVAILYWFGGEGIHGFAFCLVLGVIVGTYSSIYVASPVLLWLMNREARSTGPAVAER